MTIFIHLHISEPISTVVNFHEGISYLHRHTCVCMHTHTVVVLIVSACMFSAPCLFVFGMYVVAVQFVSVCLVSHLSR